MRYNRPSDCRVGWNVNNCVTLNQLYHTSRMELDVEISVNHNSEYFVRVVCAHHSPSRR